MSYPLTIYSEKVTAVGGLSGGGARRLLGRSKHSQLSLTLREAIQNSWDARDAAGRVTFRVELIELEQEGVKDVCNGLFPYTNRSGLKIVQQFKRHPFVLLLSDWGTTGLAGPDRADHVEVGQPRRFVDFLRNVGHHQKARGTGGTYGFGKTSLYELSGCGTIAVLTRAPVSPGAAPAVRYLGAALGDEVPGLLSGRHWWGERGPDGVADPLLGQSAVEAGAVLWMAPPQSGCGTSVAVIAPNMDCRDPASLATEITETLLFNFWPKMLSGSVGIPPLRFEVCLFDESYVVPLPESHQKIRPFVEAYHALQAQSYVAKTRDVVVQVSGSATTTGKLGWRRLQPPAGGPASRKKSWEPFGDRCAHVCLLREPELVVKYENLSAVAPGGVGFAGVFRAGAEFDGVFANAEPPAHDDWESASLQGKDKSIVAGTKRQIKTILKEEFGFSAGGAPSSLVDVPVGNLASLLGDMLFGIPGDGADVPVSPVTAPAAGTRSAQSPKRRYVCQVVSHELVGRSAGRLTSRVGVEIPAPQSVSAVVLVPSIAVLAGDGGEREAPEREADKPVSVLGWHSASGHSLTVTGDGVRCRREGNEPWTVYCKLDSSELVAVDFRVVAVIETSS